MDNEVRKLIRETENHLTTGRGRVRGNAVLNWITIFLDDNGINRNIFYSLFFFSIGLSLSFLWAFLIIGLGSKFYSFTIIQSLFKDWAESDPVSFRFLITSTIFYIFFVSKSGARLPLAIEIHRKLMTTLLNIKNRLANYRVISEEEEIYY